MGHILLVEDDAMTRQLMITMLDGLGYTVQATDNGDSAEAMAVAEKPDLILMDVMMPGRSGLEVTKAIKAHYGDAAPPVIIITAMGRHSDIEAAELAGADDYVIKPFAPDVLQKKIETVLGDQP